MRRRDLAARAAPLADWTLLGWELLGWTLLGWALLVGSGAAPAAAASRLGVVITSPAPGEPAFGVVDFSADVYPAEEALRVDFFVDGERVGEVYEEPYAVRVDLGSEVREHRFEVKAQDLAGEVATALLVSPAIRVDDAVEVELQQLYVTVSDGEERVLDLEAADFAVVDDGAAQQILTFERGDVRLVGALLIDASASMKGRRLRFALRGAAAFVEGLRQSDDASIQLFSDHLLFATPFSHDPALLTAGLAEVQAEGGTALVDHLYRALKQLEREQGRRVVVLLTDGVDTHSALRMADVQWLARRGQTLLYWIRSDAEDESVARWSSLKNAQEYRDDYRLLLRTVLDSGGRVLTLDRIEDAEDAVREILRELREQYVLGYTPSASRDDGSWRKVQVRVRRPGVEVRARNGYVDY